MQAQVKKWGNSQGIRLSKEILKSAGIALNEVLDVTVSNGVITFVKPFRHKTLEERAAEFDGKLMLDGEYDWGVPVGREVW
ncbi:AbrB/MazE/SpoVT family DNA-binding domain-containing protein [Parablautia intestinalis]|jgi:antitoxin MazE|uniref:AbrB/MazE/SpoVT family DNA-binding domain-containing protein n=1 Tax=Parablautia intestinalis TaxID=2320100 RepID=UPI0023CFAD48|nr:AbrB/MazE/SpoVT family DNA-binding domain-containing protein [Parablautia intestinalis]MCI8615953.1 AbrB/MazE/SpoVT family DNA-binding domain-containing protein [Lachnospiraceae bacterium]MDE7046547.1 AbrB/MazE/SpoVT family DNA-binding domain-containing protein [Lachnospiraceae bacterium]